MDDRVSEAHNKLVIRRLYDEVFNRSLAHVADELLSADYEGHDPPDAPPTVRGPEGMVRVAQLMKAAFPDGEFVVRDVFAVEDRVAARVEFTGRHDGDLPSPSGAVAATGKRVTMAGNVLYRMADGKIAESWGSWDLLGLFGSLGAITINASGRD